MRTQKRLDPREPENNADIRKKYRRIRRALKRLDIPTEGHIERRMPK